MKEHGYEYKQGTIITYVITKRGDSISDKARILQDVTDGDYDQDYYIDNQVIPAVARILEPPRGYSEQDLKGLGEQKTLWDYCEIYEMFLLTPLPPSLSRERLSLSPTL